jgi:succinate dehydrogenase / fumarate reductase, flavoprotein subunit
MARRSCNVLVIGAGLAGIQAAEGAAQFVSDVLLVDGRASGAPPATLGDASVFAAYLAQDAGGVGDWKSTRISVSVQGAGGSGSALDAEAIRRGFHTYVGDILRHGSHLGDPGLADFTAAGIYNRIGWLESYGLHVVRDTSGAYRGFGAPAHRLNRVLLIEEPPSNVLEQVDRSAARFGVARADGLHVTRLLVEHGRVAGAYALDVQSGEAVVIETRAIVLATGGADRLYTGPAGTLATASGARGTAGTGYVLALDAGASLANMEFVAFAPEPAPGSELPAALLMILLGLGAWLERDDGHALPRDGASVGELARCLAAATQTRAVHLRVPAAVLGAIEDLPPFRPHRSRLERPVEVRVGCRGLLGGVVHTAFATPVDGLFVAGAAATGCHGADLLPGVDTSFTLYSAENAATAAATYWSRTRPAPLSASLVRSEEKRLAELRSRPRAADDETLARLEDAVRGVMWADVGLARTATGLRGAAKRLREIGAEVERLRADCVSGLVALTELHTLVSTAELVAEAAQRREESCGQHVRIDFPVRDLVRGQEWLIADSRDGVVAWNRRPVPGAAA